MYFNTFYHTLLHYLLFYSCSFLTGKISRYEFLVYQLVNGQWNVEQQDITTIMEQFQRLDKNKDRKLSMRELGIVGS